ncbi:MULTISPECIES: hypothetical protein [Mesonia]|uniref:Uncharacterized protein n=1 Tax=Mesonia oceanica TaxID=2687242 RepID=A0AC61Y8V3_9FLAO|nr:MULTISPECIES: hypothetical protein [Mesonia]MAN28218.1 hypothetical protein [Mesonia sp.]MAQ41535.1 hypothetical protein [Mesonia sp.]MBJ96809.1 hypothetical protein [Flavobacteriaceae bacterium]VVV00949.1 hypothetical protein FVB9532_02225 [Mesonia oceanica]|tara:strand:- start:74 stop:313 length:240 start_codon:yes stop_codon:yes gene_type:complete
MGAAELRKKWKKSIKTVDVRFLQMVDALYEGYFKNEVVAYHPDGTPMTRQDYKMALDVAESQIEKGDFMTAEEFEKEEN